MVHHGRWLNHPNSLLKELERKSRKKAEELLGSTTDDINHLASHNARFVPEPVHIDIEAKADDSIPPPLGLADPDDPAPETIPDPNPEVDPEPVPEENPEPAQEPAPEPAPEDPQSDPSNTTPEPPTTIVSTIVHIVLSGGTTTIAEFTVPTLPAVVSNTALGVLTIPAETDTPIAVPFQNEHHAAEPATENSPAQDVPTPTPESAVDAPSAPVLVGATEPAPTSEATAAPDATDTSPVTSGEQPTSTASATDATDAADATNSTDATTDTTDATNTASSTTTSNASTTQTGTLSATSHLSSQTSTASGDSSGNGSGNTIMVGGAPAPGPTATSESGTEASSASGLPTPKLAGAVAGSIAGFALILILILFLLRRHKRRLRETRGTMLPDGPEETRSAPPRPPRPMSERFSGGPIVATGLFNRLRQSANSESTYETSPSERGFQKISGRKIPSVLHSGGDGYGGGFEKEVGGGKSSAFYKETGGYGGAAAASSRSGAVARQDSDSSSKDGVPLEHSVSAGSASSEVAVMRPGPARMAVTNRGPTTSESGYSTPAISAPSSRGEPMPPALLAMRDEVGRSLHDGSRGSRFREGV